MNHFSTIVQQKVLMMHDYNDKYHVDFVSWIQFHKLRFDDRFQALIVTCMLYRIKHFQMHLMDSSTSKH